MATGNLIKVPELDKMSHLGEEVCYSTATNYKSVGKSMGEKFLEGTEPPRIAESCLNNSSEEFEDVGAPYAISECQAVFWGGVFGYH